jgi:hypothetical protein
MQGAIDWADVIDFFLSGRVFAIPGRLLAGLLLLLLLALLAETRRYWRRDE